MERHSKKVRQKKYVAYHKKQVEIPNVAYLGGEENMLATWLKESKYTVAFPVT
jgi:hypothetical protein